MMSKKIKCWLQQWFVMMARFKINSQKRQVHLFAFRRVFLVYFSAVTKKGEMRNQISMFCNAYLLFGHGIVLQFINIDIQCLVVLPNAT